MKPPVRTLRCKHDVPGLRYGNREVKKGDVLADIPAGAAAELVAIGNYEYLTPAAAEQPADDPSSNSVQTSAPTTSRRAKSGRTDS